MTWWPTIAYAILAFVGGLAFIIADFFLVTLGIFSFIGLIGMIAGVWFAFQIHTVVGIIFLIIGMTFAIWAWLWGLRRLQQTKLVLQSEVDEDAGYRHRSDALGITIGSIGTLATSAMPTGRCRFEHGMIDVQVISGYGQAGQQVTVERIDGPTIFVHCAS